MLPLTLNQAARACKKSKSAILEAIRTGRLSAIRNDLQQWQIDPAELFRVYPSTQSETEQQNRDQPPAENHPTPVLLEKVANFEQKLKTTEEERERERQQMQTTIDDLRRRLDEEASERRKLTALLTHQPQTAPQPAADPAPLWRRLFGSR
jgi:predicted RNase H-like nuclease (RuvC/YqgF family)